jgi:hypothetical protein
MTSDINLRLKKIFETYPEETAEFRKKVDDNKDLCCPWHRKGNPEHKGNFGLMGDCLDCMEEIKKGRCTIDVSQFDFDMYWTVRSFWTKVDIKGPDECWLWTGATKKNNTETAAYMPSPFHKGNMQSAARVAFWTARGYVGKHRIQHKKGCDILCCNPLHLRLSQLVSIPEPTKIEKVQLNYGHLKANTKNESCSSQLLPPEES